MLPMGSIVTAAMFAILLVLLVSAFTSRFPRWLSLPVGYVTLLLGLWNALWHGLRNLDNFWGNAALGSGILMVFAAITIIRPQLVPPSILKYKIVPYLLLLGFALTYAITIARM